jgi:hypothetical protein
LTTYDSIPADLVEAAHSLVGSLDLTDVMASGRESARQAAEKVADSVGQRVADSAGRVADSAGRVADSAGQVAEHAASLTRRAGRGAPRRIQSWILVIVTLGLLLIIAGVVRHRIRNGKGTAYSGDGRS